jgi:hypothetical protein
VGDCVDAQVGRADALAEQVEDAAGSTAQIDDALARLDPDPLELVVGVGGEVRDLSLECCPAVLMRGDAAGWVMREAALSRDF